MITFRLLLLDNLCILIKVDNKHMKLDIPFENEELSNENQRKTTAVEIYF